MIQARYVQTGMTIKNFAGEPEEVQYAWATGDRMRIIFVSGNEWSLPLYSLVTVINHPYTIVGSREALAEAERILREEVTVDGEYTTRDVSIPVDTLTELVRALRES